MTKKIKEVLHKNRYFYQIFLSTKSCSGGVKLLRLFQSAIQILPKHLFNLWDYVQPIRENDYIIQLKKYPEIKMYVPLFLRDGIQRIIANSEDFFEAEILNDLKKYIPRDAIVIDIGANIGNHTVFFSKVAGAKKVYSFEPVADTYKILSRNIKINNLESVVTTYNFALGKAEGRAKIVAFNETNIGGAKLGEAKDGGIKIYSLDELDINEKIDFMKIDVEGFENNVLVGGTNTIEKYRPIIFIEIQKENRDKVQKFFEEKEYRLIKEYEADNFLFAYKEDRFWK